VIRLSKETTTHYHPQDFPERATITRPHHPFQGQSLEVLRHAQMRGCLQLFLILPDASRSLVPAAWTDFHTGSPAPLPSLLVGSPEDLLRLRGVVDALPRRSADMSVPSW